MNTINAESFLNRAKKEGFSSITMAKIQKLISEEVSVPRSLSCTTLNGKGVCLVEVEKIAYIHSAQKFLFVNLVDGRELLLHQKYPSLSHLEQVLEPAMFKKASRNYLVSLNNATKFSGSDGVLDIHYQDCVITCSRRRSKEIKEALPAL